MKRIVAFWNNNKKESWFIVMFLLLFFPVGLYLMWRYSEWDKKPKWIVTGVFALFVVFNQGDDEAEDIITDEPDEVQAVEESDEVHEETNKEEAKKAAEEERKQEEAEKAAEEGRKQEEAEKAAEEERKQEEAEKAAEEERKQEEAEKAAEEERKQEEAEKAAEEERKQEEAEKAAEEERKQEEAEKAAEEEPEQEEAEKAAEEVAELSTEEYKEIVESYMVQLITVGEDLSEFGLELENAGLTLRAKDLIYSAHMGYDLMSERLDEELAGKMVPVEYQRFHEELLDFDRNIGEYLRDTFNASENEDLFAMENAASTSEQLITQMNDLVYLYPF
ncbi:hypothetical protein [Salinicoccus sp. RF5]|uniref:hypothetical protein n=1 Tax=Salinicoccus sp. RF5 TaxID=2748874 RepID=UPI001E5FAD54|nr:hypothetical protein [Salinicoccus sp. RF5]MCC4723357.1 hypothetical protein [Salinicoccus sp. RF5]